uniref:Putative secreted protein n=1 Tax=Anopheles darlingi TaxID=43151 RepID=A0A2M4D7W5_ANODA
MRSSCAWMSASTSWCFFIRFCTEARSLPASSEVSRLSTSPSQKSRSLTAAIYVRCLFASFSFNDFSVVFCVRYSHWSAICVSRF